MISFNTNMASLYASQAVSLNSRGHLSAIEQLSTGKQLNRSSENVAGMAISVSLASQIKAINQAVRNANDGSSVLVTADTALVQISNMLQRMRELSVQSINSTVKAEDRNAFNFEFQQLKTQISMISSTTQWNDINVLNGVIGADWDGKFNFQVGSYPDQTIGTEILNLEQIPAVDVTGGNNLSKIFRFNSGVTAWTPTNFDPTQPYQYDSSDSGWDSQVDDPFPSTFAAFGFDMSIPQKIGSVYDVSISLKVNDVEVASAKIGLPEIEAIGGAIGDVYFDPRVTPSQDGKIYPTGTELSTTMIAKLKEAFGNESFDGGYLVIDDSTPHVLSVGYLTRDGGATGPGTDDTRSDDNFTVSFAGIDGWAHSEVDPEQRFDLSVLDSSNETTGSAQDQLGRVIKARFGNGSDIVLGSYTISQSDINAIDGGVKLSESLVKGLADVLTATGIQKGIQTNILSEPGVLTVNWAHPSAGGTTGSVRAESSFPLSNAVILTSETASQALGNVDSAFDVLNFLRAKIGAAMSALQSRSEVLGIMSIKLQEAASRLSDTNYAQTTSALLKHNILQNSGLAMLAQANQNPYLVLNLLKFGSRN